MVNTLQTRWRGKLPIPKHAHPLVRQMFRRMNQEMTTVREVATRAGLRPGTISEWRYSRTPNVIDLEAALNVLDCQLVIRSRSS